METFPTTTNNIMFMRLKRFDLQNVYEPQCSVMAKHGLW